MRKSEVSLLSVLTLSALLIAPFAQTPAVAGEIVITCTGCENSSTDIFVAEAHQLKEAFNTRFAGQYRIEEVPFAGINDEAQSIPYFKRLAASGNLPDIWWAPGSAINDLGRTDMLLDWAPILKQEAAWQESFYPDAFLGLTDEQGSIWGIPSFRDAIGVFWNKALFAKAGLSDFPDNWEGLLKASAKLKQAGITPFAMDGMWVTLLWWSHLIGVEPGGEEFLSGGIRKGGFENMPAVVTATERLKQLHTDGYVNANAFSGDFFAAETPFVTEKAAILANGPWEISSGIKGKNAAASLYDNVGYAPAPGKGVIVVSGEGAWAASSTEPAKVEAITAFMKFITSPEQLIAKYKAVGGAWPNDLGLDESALGDILDPLYLPVFQAAADDTYHRYPHALFLVPAAFRDSWQNNWPAYVQNAMSTHDFLAALSSAVAPN